MSAQIAVPAECSSGSRTVGQVAEVLVVDDNPIDRLRAGRLIDQDRRCHATYAEDGTQALARLADHPTSVVLTDLQMEGMDGLNLVRAIRNKHPKVPVIVMTGHGSEDVAMERSVWELPITFPSRGWPRIFMPSWRGAPDSDGGQPAPPVFAVPGHPRIAL